jgi:hypothetical protein
LNVDVVDFLEAIAQVNGMHPVAVLKRMFFRPDKSPEGTIVRCPVLEAQPGTFRLNSATRENSELLQFG